MQSMQRVLATTRRVPSTDPQRLSFRDYLIGARLQVPPHLEFIVDLIERVNSGEPVRAVIAMPPRHGKTLALQRGIAWLLAQDPTASAAYVTYADDVSRSKSRQIRRWALDLGVQLDQGSKSVQEWRTPQDGGLMATGVGGPLTGQGVNRLLVIDDPLKNRAEADSRLIRDRVHDWWTSVAYTRLEGSAAVIVVATRWHDDDLSGRLLRPDPDADTEDAREHFESINLAAMAEEDDPLGREFGEALWPARYPLPRLKRIRATVGEYDWASLYQQRPRPRGDTLFGRPQTYKPEHLAKHATSGTMLVAGMDTGYSAKTKSDASAVIEAMVWRDPMLDGRPRAYVTRIIHGRMRVPEFAGRIKAEIKAPWIRWRLYGAEQGTADLLQDDYGLHLITESPQTDKYAYAMPASVAWNAGLIQLPEWPEGHPQRAFVNALTMEATDFTGADDLHDDLVDALASMWREVLDALPSEEAARILGGQA